MFSILDYLGNIPRDIVLAEYDSFAFSLTKCFGKAICIYSFTFATKIFCSFTSQEKIGFYHNVSEIYDEWHKNTSYC